MTATTGESGSTLLVEDRPGGVRVLTLDRPQRRNAIDRELFAALIAAIEELDRCEEVGAAVITGAASAFCAGVDLSDVGDRELLAERRRSGINPAASLLAARTPVIAAVGGACVGGGLELALACDFILAAEEATFRDPHVQLGLLPSWGASATLPAAIGTRSARFLALSGEEIDAARALELGLVTEVMPAAGLMPRALALATAMAAAPAARVRALSRLYALGEGCGLDERLALEREALLAGPVGAAPDERGEDG